MASRANNSEAGNIIRPRTIETDAVCPRIADLEIIGDDCVDYLSDESRLPHCCATTIYFPTTTEETVAAVKETAGGRHKLVISGGRTGIVGGATVTSACHLISLEKLRVRPVVRFDADSGHWCVKTGAGMTIGELASALEAEDFDVRDRRPEHALLYPVDPTEDTAQLGGTLATNASGARTLFYGPTRKWVQWLKMVLADGRVLALRRGEVRADGLNFQIADQNGKLRSFSLPEVPLPRAKATVGYAAARNMDAVDLIVGSEGTLGIITELELRLIERPAEIFSVCQYFSSEAAAVDFVLKLKAREDLAPLASEYFGPRALDLLRQRRSDEGSGSAIPSLPDDVWCIIYMEWTLACETELNPLIEQLESLVAAVGASPEKSWAGLSEKELGRMKELRHLLPEAINAIIAERKRIRPEIHKVGSDMAVPIDHVKKMLRVYRKELEASGLEHVIFGHIGDGHLHINVLPRDAEDISRAEAMYRKFAATVVRLGGSVSAEHGIGKIKRDFLLIQFSPETVAQMREIKLAFDPEELLNPGVLFAEEV